ncbi:MAG: DUF5367 family protein [Caulobacterales bacterium]|jgi:hypothetical protein
MILKSAALGFVLWLVAVLLFRFYGHLVFFPGEGQMMLLAGATVAAFVPLTALILKLLGEDPTDRAEAAVGLAFPGMLLDALAAHNFDLAFPNIDPTLAGSFGALSLLTAATIVLTGLFMTRLAPRDERL